MAIFIGSMDIMKRCYQNSTNLDNFMALLGDQWYLYLHSAQVITDYLKPLCSDNEYIIRNTQKFQKLLQQQDLLLPNEEYVSYDAKSLFTNLLHLRNN